MLFNNFLKKTSTRNQYISTIVVNIIVFSHGCTIGWFSPFIAYLKSSNTHLKSGPLTSEDVSWIGSLICVGGLLGIIAFGTITEKCGKKISLFLLVIPHLTFWSLVYFSTHAYHLYLARFISGITGGGALRTVPLFITEISENKIRGVLGSLYIFALSGGTLMVFIIGAYANFFVVPLVMLVLPTIFVASLFCLRDTPQSLIARKKYNQAFESLKFYRSCGNDKIAIESVKVEFEVLKNNLKTRKEEKLELSDFSTNPARRGIIIGVFLMFLNQFSGTLAVFTYTAEIFNRSGSSLNPNESSIIVAFIQLIGVYVSTLSVDRFGRKILMVVSTIGTSIFLTTLGTYSYLSKIGLDVSHLALVPVISLSLVIFLASLGIISLPFIITTELLPNKVRNVACTLCMSSVTVFAFIVLKIFPPLVEAFELYGCMWLFASVCLLGTIVTIIFIQETKGKSLVIEETL